MTNQGNTLQKITQPIFISVNDYNAWTGLKIQFYVAEDASLYKNS